MMREAQTIASKLGIDTLVGSMAALGRLTNTPTSHIDTTCAMVKLPASTMKKAHEPPRLLQTAWAGPAAFKFFTT